MSLILDALNRAERERKGSAVPDLQTVHELPPAPATPSTKSSGVLFGLIAGALILAGAVIYFMVREQPVITQSAVNFSSAPATSPTAAMEPPIVEPSPTAEPSSTTKPSSREDQPPASPALSEKDLTARINPNNALPEKNTLRASAASSLTADLAALYASAREETIPEKVVDELYEAPPAKNIEAETEVKHEPETQVPTTKNYASLVELPDIGDLPWVFRKQIPTINYVRHNFLPEGAQSVVINGRAYHAGNNLAPDLVLEEIIIDGVILRFKQTRFKLRALNSWINM